MELALSLGDAPTPFSFFEKSQKIVGKDLGLWMAVEASEDGGIKKPADPPLQLDLLPFSPLHTTNPSSNNFPINWIHKKLSAEPGKKRRFGEGGDEEEGPSLSSPIAVSSFQMDFSIFGWNGTHSDQIINHGQEADRGGSDEEENGSMGRKKLRLSKQQSAFLEQSFKEHSTLNPKQKLALSKQLNLRPRQVEVWFQNRRARTKLKQTEVDCEYLKKCCETLSEENRRLQKELQELRALKAASQPFYMQMPATTLSMCPSCQKVTDCSSNVSSAHQPQPSS